MPVCRLFCLHVVLLWCAGLVEWFHWLQSTIYTVSHFPYCQGHADGWIHASLSEKTFVYHRGELWHSSSRYFRKIQVKVRATSMRRRSGNTIRAGGEFLRFVWLIYLNNNKKITKKNRVETVTSCIAHKTKENRRKNPFPEEDTNQKIHWLANFEFVGDRITQSEKKERDSTSWMKEGKGSQREYTTNTHTHTRTRKTPFVVSVKLQTNDK